MDQGSRTIINAIPDTAWYARKEINDTSSPRISTEYDVLQLAKDCKIGLLMPSAQQGKSFQILWAAIK